MAPTHTHRLRVRYSECDPQGNVFNANYLTYFDIALTELWREAAGSYKTMLEEGVDMVVAEATVKYRASAHFDDELDVAITVAHLGNTSMVTDVGISRDGDLLVEGRMVHVFVSLETMAKTEIPPKIRAALS
jgi:acyl-CoA thioester hydrolase